MNNCHIGRRYAVLVEAGDGYWFKCPNCGKAVYPHRIWVHNNEYSCQHCKKRPLITFSERRLIAVAAP